MGDNVIGAEGIVIHGDKIVLGMQKLKRWYQLENGEKAAIVKTLGGALKDIDKNDSKKALIREILEEVKGIKEKDISVSETPIFTKEINMGELNPYEEKSALKMKADFYAVEIHKNFKLIPNDLPLLFEIPIADFLKLEFSKNLPLSNIKNYMIEGEKITIPDSYAIMAPNEIKDFLKRKGEEAK